MHVGNGVNKLLTMSVKLNNNNLTMIIEDDFLREHKDSHRVT